MLSFGIANVIFAKTFSPFATEILGRFFVLLPEGVVTYVEWEKTGNLPKISVANGENVLANITFAIPKDSIKPF